MAQGAFHHLPILANSQQPNNHGHSITTIADLHRLKAYQEVSDQTRAENGQYFTPPITARMMAAFFADPPAEVHLLDAGAGIGTLTAAVIEDMLARPHLPQSIHVTAYEKEVKFCPYLEQALQSCARLCDAHNIRFAYIIKTEDFITAAAASLRPGLFTSAPARYNRAILNPPYKKINSKSLHRRLLSAVGIETVNLYTAFVALIAGLLEPEGELVAITPRSFCNGPYYTPFRQLFDAQMAFKRIHLFEARNKAFAADDVLQENIIFHAIKKTERESVTITGSYSPEDEVHLRREVAYQRVLNPTDPHLFIHITASDLGQNVADRIGLFSCTLVDLGIGVSTGRVVDFRAETYLRQQSTEQTVPLIYPHHMQNGFVAWPHPTNHKANAFVYSAETAHWLLPAGHYVVVRRFSSKEEPRRINAAVYDPEKIGATAVAFENHVNVFHARNRGMPPALARGLTLFLNATLLDVYFRQFNGHTQVNATDLRSLRYPHRDTLLRWGTVYTDHFPDQQTIDSLIELELQTMADLKTPDPIAAKRRVAEALQILVALDLPRTQQNERSAMTLLALLALTPEQPWTQAQAPLLGITPIMDFIRDQYGVAYAPNTRETIRRQSVHQFVQAALVIENPDQPDRPKNSPYWCYQIEPAALDLLCSYDSEAWDVNLAAYLSNVTTLKERYAQQRKMHETPVRVATGLEITLSPGEHSQLLKQIIEAFAPRFVPDGQLVYVGDTGDKWAYFDARLLDSLGVTVDPHGKMPDVVIYDEQKGWLLLVEAVTSHGPVNPKRRIELQELFAPVQDSLVYVTVFATRGSMARHVKDISWATEVWVADDPTHLIHFDGVRFLGPYGSDL